MLDAVSSADAAVVVVDARKGFTADAQRDAFLVSLLGARPVVAVVGNAESQLESIRAEVGELSRRLRVAEIPVITVSTPQADDPLLQAWLGL